jgi:hypothetical protein
VKRPTITGKGVIGDKVTLRDGSKVLGTAVVGKGGTWSMTPTSALAAGLHVLTATESGKTGTSDPSAALKLTIKTSAPAPSGLAFAVAADKGAAGDTLRIGGTGEAGDRVTLFDRGKAVGSVKVGVGGGWTLTTTKPLAIGGHSLSVSETDVAGNTSARSPAQGLTIGRAAPNSLVFFGTAGADHFTGGAGKDVFSFSAANLGKGDVVAGAGGADTLKLTSAGTIRASGVGGVETYLLAAGGGNVLTLANANFAGAIGSTITVDGGNAADILSEAGVSGRDKAVLDGKAGADTLIAGRNAVLAGGAGKDLFELTLTGTAAAPVSVTVTDFAHSADKIALSKKGFALGATPSAATLFTANASGRFTTAAQRFAYDTSNGDLFYDSRGSGAGSTRLEIASFAHHPTLTAVDIAFTA